jgi:transcriptional regulator with XRE-family HTH domain
VKNIFTYNIAVCYIITVSDKSSGGEAMTLQELRKSKGYTQKGLANELGLSQPYVAELEKGTKKPSYETLIKLAKILEITVDELIKVLEG